MKAIFSILFSLSLLEACLSQSFIGASIGMDYAKIEESFYPNPVYFEVLENGYSSNSIYLGIRGEQQIAEQLPLSLAFSFTKKETNAFVMNIVGTEGLKLNLYRSSLSANWYPFGNFYLGTGVSLTYISNVRVFFAGGNREGNFLMDDKKEIGAIFSSGYRYRNFLAEVYFNKGLFPNSTEEIDSDFKPINSFGLSLSYLLQVGKGRR